jgi:hypothetical protein
MRCSLLLWLMLATCLLATQSLCLPVAEERLAGAILVVGDGTSSSITLATRQGSWTRTAR